MTQRTSFRHNTSGISRRGELPRPGVRFGARDGARGQRGPARKDDKHPEDHVRGENTQARWEGRREQGRTKKEYQAWCATQNIGTLKGREDKVLDWAVQEKLDIWTFTIDRYSAARPRSGATGPSLAIGT